MERESLLATLIVLLGGLALQLFAVWPGRIRARSAARQLERRHWLLLWWPIAPALTVAAWLCGWALSQPDPVPAHVGPPVFIAACPFAIVGGRALMRALWSLRAVWWSRRSATAHGIATVGLLRPRIVVMPELAQSLDARALAAAIAHERMHVRHRDPLRIWLAQFATDLQWPWRPAGRRFDAWLANLEHARDDEARAGGVDGADLAAAVLGALRYQRTAAAAAATASIAAATLTGRPEALAARIARLLNPLPEAPAEDESRDLVWVAGSLAAAWLGAVALGVTFGARMIDGLLALCS